MRRSTNTLIHSLKDQVRTVRYSIKAEAEAPGSGLPKVLRDMELGPLLAIGSLVGSPALRLADGIFSQVESFATGVLASQTPPAPFPCPVTAYFGGDAVSFSTRVYGPLDRILRQHGARATLVSEHALEAAWSQVQARHGDVTPSASDGSGAAADRLVQVCAGLAVAFVEARPIRKVAFGTAATIRPHFMLSPNLYCGMVVGLATAVVTLDPTLAADPEGVLDSVDSAVDARFGRFNQALTGKRPIQDLAREFHVILPFLP